MRLIMLGNGPFAVPMLRALWTSAHDLQCVVVRPPRMGRGRHRHPPPSPVQLVAEELGARVFAPPTVNDDTVRVQLAALRPELCVVCDYGEILRPATIDLAPRGAINLHGSLLPKYRGAAPVAWAIYHGETETGNTVFQLSPGVDAGPILSQQRLAIDPDETAGELEARLAAAGASLVVDTVDGLAAGSIEPVEQDASLATKAPRLKKADGQIDWSRPAGAIKDQVRAMQPWPRGFTHWQRPDGAPLRLILTRVEPSDRHAGGGVESDAAPGAVLSVDNQLTLAAGDGSLEIIQLQPAGKRTMSAVEFLRGHAVEVGQHFGSSSVG